MCEIGQYSELQLLRAPEDLLSSRASHVFKIVLLLNEETEPHSYYTNIHTLSTLTKAASQGLQTN